MREKDRALQMLDIMIERIKDARNDTERERRLYRVAGAIFILYFIDIITYEEQRELEDRIFRT